MKKRAILASSAIVAAALLAVIVGGMAARAALDGTGAGLVGWWKMNESAGATSAADSSGGGHAATLTGAGYANNLPQFVSGQMGNALSFDGGDDKADAGDINTAEATDTLTMSAWVKNTYTSTSTDQVIMSKIRAFSGFPGWILYRKATTGKFSFTVYVSSSVGVSSASGYADTNWHHVVGVYDGGHIYLYVDGSSVATPAVLTGSVPDSARHVCIGQTNGAGGTCDNSSSGLWSGSIDDVRIYNRALSSTEVAQLYSNGAAGIDTVSAPTVTTSAASSITSTTVVGNGNITSTGGDPVSDRGFRYGLTTAYGASTTPDTGSYGTGAFTETISGLTCNTAYHYQSYATNSKGTSYGSDQTFTTATCSAVAPTMTTAAATATTSTSAVLHGSIDDTGNADPTARGFAYGATVAYGATTTESGTFSTGSFSTTTTGLSCETTYHYRAFATNTGGTGYGSDQTFTTGTCSPSITAFSIPSAASGTTTIAITSLTATDDQAVTGYLLRYAPTTTPVSTDPDWTASAPTKFTFATAGPKVLYAWAKDAQGHISATSTATTSVSLASYDSPVGIPDPSDSFGSFGPINRATPSWPAEWLAEPTSAKTNYYFVDNSDASCTNSSNTYGHPDLPRCSLPEGSLSAGTFLYVNGGTYAGVDSAGDRFDWCGAGTDASPIWVTGNPYSIPVLQDKVHLGYTCATSYLIFENFKIEGPGGITVNQAADDHDIDHLIIRNIEKIGTASTGDSAGIAIGGLSTTDTSPNHEVSYIVVYDVRVHDIGFVGWVGTTCPSTGIVVAAIGDCPEGDEPAVISGYHVDHLWVLDSTLYHVGSDDVAGSHYSNGTTKRTRYYYIGRNNLYQGGENCVDLKTVEFTVVSSNTCTGPFSDENGWGMVFHYGANTVPTQDIWALFNTISGAGGGMDVTLGTNLYWIGNEVHDLYEAGVNDDLDGACFGMRGFSGTGVIADNTCTGYTNGIRVTSSALSSGDSLDIHGNIFSDRASTTQYELRVDSSSELAYVDADYNLFHYPSGAARFFWGGSAKDLSQVKSVGDCTNCIESDPLFTDAANDDFSLGSLSPAKDASTEDPIYATFESLFGLNIRKDILGIWRPQNASWDMGAYERAVADAAAPVISSISSSPATSTATIAWSTDEYASSTVEYGTTAGYGTASSSDSYVSSHSILLSGLEPDTTYHFRVSSADTSYNEAVSSDQTFTTDPLPAADPSDSSQPSSSSSASDMNVVSGLGSGPSSYTAPLFAPGYGQGAPVQRPPVPTNPAGPGLETEPGKAIPPKAGGGAGSVPEPTAPISVVIGEAPASPSKENAQEASSTERPAFPKPSFFVAITQAVSAFLSKIFGFIGL